mmetsp:Transcript_44331/g.53564  ORF Transcript_44331/g.53564 Transcript_44331/m.53564 type:complete len:204 (+) Transcript_44331:607-1218(+)
MSIGQSLSNFNSTTDKSLATDAKTMESEDRTNDSKQNSDFANGINVNIAELSQTVGNYLNSVGLGGFLLPSGKTGQEKDESASTVEQVKVMETDDSRNVSDAIEEKAEKEGVDVSDDKVNRGIEGVEREVNIPDDSAPESIISSVGLDGASHIKPVFDTQQFDRKDDEVSRLTAEEVVTNGVLIVLEKTGTKLMDLPKEPLSK